MDGNSELLNRERGGEIEREEKRQRCDAAFIPHRETWENSWMCDSELASAVFTQYDREKGQITEHLIICKELIEQVIAFNRSVGAKV